MKVQLLPVQEQASRTQMISHINHNFTEISRALNELSEQIQALQRNS